MSKSKRLVEIPPEIEAEMTPSVKAFVLAAFAKFEERISALEEQVEKLTPRNSSMPPGSEHPHARPKPKRKPGKKRKQGGQNGHKRHLRELIPSDDCDQVVRCKPTGCRRCGGELQEDPSEPRRHQV